MGAGVRRHKLGILSLLLLSLWPCMTAQPSCPVRATPPELEMPGKWSVQPNSADGGFMSSIVHSFLKSVQSNPFPKDLIIKIVNSGTATTETIKEVLRYEAGFLVCVAIGILYIILMPLIGFCFACCRCCGNCGGRMYQKQTNSIHCKRRVFYWATLLITVCILAGNICMFLSNTYTGESVKTGVGEVSNTLENLQSYINTVPKQIDQVLNESSVTVDEVTCHINGSGHFLGKQIQNGLEGPLTPGLESVRTMAQVVNSTSLLLVELNRTQSQLQTELGVLQANLTSVRDRINGTLHKTNCLGCDLFQSKLDRLSLDTNLNTPNLTELQSAVDQAVNADLNAQIKKVEDFFDSIPQRVTNETRGSVQGIQQQLQNIKSQVSQVATDLPYETLTDISSTLSDVQTSISTNVHHAKSAEQIRWIVALVLCCLILLVVVCNLLGLLLGPPGLKPKDDPTDRSSTANCGGLFLMAGVGFSFLFSWIFMIVVLILFVVGGNVYTLVCVPWRTGELFQFIDTPGVIPELQLSQSLGLKTNLTITGVYNDCHKNESLWNTLHLAEIVNLNDFLNISKYTAQVQQDFEKSQISLPNITLLSSGIQNQLRNFSTRASSVNFSSIIQKINTFSKTDLNLTADELDRLANNQTNTTIKTELQNEANDLRFIQTQINITINPLMEQLKSTVERLSVQSSQVNGTVEDVLQKVSYAQDFLNNNTTQIVKSKTREFIDSQMGILTKFAEWANYTITEQVGRCGLVAAAVDTAENLVCTKLVDSVNAFWFSLGWCMVFLIPSIIFSVKLAKFYRRMKHTDVYENRIMMHPIPRANMKSY
ncbi:prominin-2 [Colossoma macropomum]|uniref:prominin-2 n=1 Tax=Colossoma macropomum TaxID=42526 RepID=UPI001863B902|nr:prominin-2 [Colossoma macropomum]